MRFADTLGATITVLAVMLPASARAQDLRLQGLFNGSIGFTDNVANAPSVPPPGGVGPQADLLFVLSPGAALLLDSPRASYRLGYVFTATLYGSHGEANSYTNLLTLGSRFETSETTSLFIGLSGEQGQLNAINVAAPAVTTPIQATPPGDNIFFRGAVTEAFEKEMSEALTLTQGTAFTSYVPLGGQRAYYFDNTLGAIRTWEHDTGTLTFGVGYARFESTRDFTGALVPANAQLLNRATVGWIHDYGHYFSTEASGGVLFSLRADNGEGRLVQPLVLAAARYIRDEAQTELVYTHTGTPNLLLGTNTLSDSVIGRVGLPIAATYLSFSSAGGFIRTHEINADGKLGNPIDQWQADAALSWAPLSTAGNLEVSLRYQIVDVLGDSKPKPGFNAAPAFVRNTVLLTLSVAYPDVNAATAPPALAAPYRPRPQGTEDIQRLQHTPEGPRTPGTPGAPRAPSSP